MVPKFQPQSAPAIPAPGVAKDPPRAGPSTRRGGTGLRPGRGRREPSLAAEDPSAKRPELRQTSFGGKKAVILWDGRTRTAAAYAPETEGTVVASR